MILERLINIYLKDEDEEEEEAKEEKRRRSISLYIVTLF